MINNNGPNVAQKDGFSNIMTIEVEEGIVVANILINIIIIRTTGMI